MNPLDFLRKIDGMLREMRAMGDLCSYVLSIPSAENTEVIESWKAISAEGDV